MPLYSFEDAKPDVAPTAWIAPTAVLVGNVTVEENASVWYGCVLRADFGPIIVAAGANVQDNTVIHGGPDGTRIGKGATIGHQCVIHGSVIGEEALIGNGSTVQDGSVIGARSLVGAGALVAPNTQIPDETLALGSPAKSTGPLTPGARIWVERNPLAYQDLARRHSATVTRLD